MQKYTHQAEKRRVNVPREVNLIDWPQTVKVKDTRQVTHETPLQQVAVGNCQQE